MLSVYFTSCWFHTGSSVREVTCLLALCCVTGNLSDSWSAVIVYLEFRLPVRSFELPDGEIAALKLAPNIKCVSQLIPSDMQNRHTNHDSADHLVSELLMLINPVICQRAD